MEKAGGRTRFEPGGQTTRMAGGRSGWAFEGTLGRRRTSGWRPWPQAYKSKRGASGGRGTAGRVGEAGPFLLGRSRRMRVSSRDGWGGGRVRWDGTEADLPRSADTATPWLKSGGHLSEQQARGAASP